MIAIPLQQAEELKFLFEEFFKEGEEYLDLVDVDEIYAYIIGLDVREDFVDAIEQTAYIDEQNLVMLIFFGEWMELIEKDAVNLEYYELAGNCAEFKRLLTPLIYKEHE